MLGGTTGVKGFRSSIAREAPVLRSPLNGSPVQGKTRVSSRRPYCTQPSYWNLRIFTMNLRWCFVSVGWGHPPGHGRIRGRTSPLGDPAGDSGSASQRHCPPFVNRQARGIGRAAGAMALLLVTRVFFPFPPTFGMHAGGDQWMVALCRRSGKLNFSDESTGRSFHELLRTAGCFRQGRTG